MANLDLLQIKQLWSKVWKGSLEGGFKILLHCQPELIFLIGQCLNLAGGSMFWISPPHIKTNLDGEKFLEENISQVLMFIFSALLWIFYSSALINYMFINRKKKAINNTFRSNPVIMVESEFLNLCIYRNIFGLWSNRKFLRWLLEKSHWLGARGD